MNNIIVKQSNYTSELKQKLIDGLSEHAIATIGINPWDGQAIAFAAYDDTIFIGGVALDFIHKQIHVKQLFVDPKYRGKGIGSKLMQAALEFGRNNGCTFVFLETLSYQAVDFYQKLGFSVDFIRDGFENGISLLYLKKSLST